MFASSDSDLLEFSECISEANELAKLKSPPSFVQYYESLEEPEQRFYLVTEHIQVRITAEV